VKPIAKTRFKEHLPSKTKSMQKPWHFAMFAHVLGRDGCIFFSRKHRRAALLCIKKKMTFYINHV
jgi:hypothetical protein